VKASGNGSDGSDLSDLFIHLIALKIHTGNSVFFGFVETLRGHKKEEGNTKTGGVSPPPCSTPIKIFFGQGSIGTFKEISEIKEILPYPNLGRQSGGAEPRKREEILELPICKVDLRGFLRSQKKIKSLSLINNLAVKITKYFTAIASHGEKG